MLFVVALCNGADHYIFALWFLSFLFLTFLFPRLISAVGDWMSTYFHTWCTLTANLECISEMCCTRLAENTGYKKSAFWHHRTTLSGCVFAAEACIDNRKKNLLNIDTSSTCRHNMVNYYSRLGSVTARHCSSGCQPNFAALNRGRHLYLAGQPSRWALAHILVHHSSNFHYYFIRLYINFCVVANCNINCTLVQLTLVLLNAT